MSTDALTRENYFSTKLLEGVPVVNNGCLSYILPDEGGSFEKFRTYLEGEVEDEETKSLSLGKKVHRFMENPGEFEVAPEDLPGPKVCEIVQKVYREAKEKNSLNVNDLANWNVAIQKAAQEVNYQQNWKGDTIAKKVAEEGQGYFSFLLRADGKVAVTAQERIKIGGMTANLQNSGHTDIMMNPEALKEHPVLFKTSMFPDIPCKVLLDNMVILRNERKVIIDDLKTTGFPISKFMGYSATVPDMSGKPVKQMFSGSFQMFRYYRQLAFYVMGASAYLRQLEEDPEEYQFSANIVAVESEAPYEVERFNISPEWLEAGRMEVFSGMKLVKQYMKIHKLGEF